MRVSCKSAWVMRERLWQRCHVFFFERVALTYTYIYLYVRLLNIYIYIRVYMNMNVWRNRYWKTICTYIHTGHIGRTYKHTYIYIHTQYMHTCRDGNRPIFKQTWTLLNLCKRPYRRHPVLPQLFGPCEHTSNLFYVNTCVYVCVCVCVCVNLPQRHIFHTTWAYFWFILCKVYLSHSYVYVRTYIHTYIHTYLHMTWLLCVFAGRNKFAKRGSKRYVTLGHKYIYIYIHTHHTCTSCMCIIHMYEWVCPTPRNLCVGVYVYMFICMHDSMNMFTNVHSIRSCICG